MTIADWIMVVAVLVGPVIAVQLTRYLDKKREIRERKLQVFKTLMSTRGYTTSWEHVVALNRIDIEFDKQNTKEKEVIEAWKAYLDHLNAKEIPIEHWAVKRIELFVELLHRMAQVLNYDFDKTHIKNSSYAPMAHETLEKQQEAIRKGVIDLLDGKRRLPVHVGEHLL
jgi:hypothetical protein